ncbi:DUF4158 domain-containing protein [Nocardia tengchongensis]|uniref:hypothetical protein n=1 Tax=Nocardia tengchongensis TaxID=2055889 RepID=UPI0036C2F257
MKSYTDRGKTKLEHAWEIQREYDLVPFAEVEDELVAWIADQAQALRRPLSDQMRSMTDCAQVAFQ